MVEQQISAMNMQMMDKLMYAITCNGTHRKDYKGFRDISNYVSQNDRVKKPLAKYACMHPFCV